MSIMQTWIEKLKQQALPEPIAILGAGATGQSFAALLQSADIAFTVLDEKCTQTSEPVNFTAELLQNYSTLLLSPGIARARDCFVGQAHKLIGDVELFARLCDKPIYALTGSNGKTTTISLLDTICQDSAKSTGRHYIACGNIGLPVLSALIQGESDDRCAGYLLELSSYQLESAPSLRVEMGAVLNVSEDHLDRYASFAQYVDAKLNLLRQSRLRLINSADARLQQAVVGASDRVNLAASQCFSLNDAQSDAFVAEGLIHYRDAMGQVHQLMSVDSVTLLGAHNLENILAAVCFAKQLGVADVGLATSIAQFKGVAHRLQTVLESSGVRFINDSKATNVDAAMTALTACQGSVIWLAGGQGKGQSFLPLAAVVREKVRAMILFGADADQLEAQLGGLTPCYRVNNLQDAVQQACQLAQSGETVLLSPACASFDQFKSYLDRGEQFIKAVQSVTQTVHQPKEQQEEKHG